jgi:hypothetical protein
MTPAVLLVLLGLVDAAFSGFRAYAGRDARIRKRRPVARSALRGLAVGPVALLVPASVGTVVLLTAPGPHHTYATLAAGAHGYLLPLAAYTVAVLLSLGAYFFLPFRASTLAMVVGLGPLSCCVRWSSLRPVWVRCSQVVAGGPCWSARSRAPPCCASSRWCTGAGTATCSSSSVGQRADLGQAAAAHLGHSPR